MVEKADLHRSAKNSVTALRLTGIKLSGTQNLFTAVPWKEYLAADKEPELVSPQPRDLSGIRLSNN